MQQVGAGRRQELTLSAAVKNHARFIAGPIIDHPIMREVNLLEPVACCVAESRQTRTHCLKARKRLSDRKTMRASLLVRSLIIQLCERLICWNRSRVVLPNPGKLAPTA